MDNCTAGAVGGAAGRVPLRLGFWKDSAASCQTAADPFAPRPATVASYPGSIHETHYSKPDRTPEVRADSAEEPRHFGKIHNELSP